MSQVELLTAGPLSHGATSSAALPHVLLVVDGFPKTLGGGERIVLRLAELLPHYGFRASILTFVRHPESSFRLEDAPCPVYLLPLHNTYGLEAWRGALALRRFLREQQVELVQTFFESSDIWAGFVTRLFSSAKLVWNRRDMGILRGRKHTVAYRALRRFPHAVFAVSERVAQHVMAVDGVPSSRVHVVYNGLDLDALAPKQRAPLSEAPVITTIGNVRHVKGHDLLIEAAAIVTKRFPSAQFTIAGDILEQEYFASLQEQVANLGLTGNVHFLGRISDLRAHLATADLFVLPSRSEGFSNALIEAMAAGLPSIATDVGGNAEAIRDGHSGLIVPPDDASSLALAITRVLEDPHLKMNLASGGWRSVEEHFTSAAMMRKTAETFRILLEK